MNQSYQIKIAPLALEDLLKTKRYIAEELHDPTAANRIIGAILARIDSLKTFPSIGESLSNKIAIQCEYRYIVCHNYLVFYRIAEKNIHVTRVLYAKSDYLNTLFG